MLREYAERMRNGEIKADKVPFKSASDRKFWTQFYKDSTNPIMNEAEEYLNYKWPSLLATDFLEFERSGNRRAWESPWFNRRRVLATLVLAESLEYKGRFLDDITNGLVLTCEETYWGLSAHRYGGSTGIQENYDPYLDIFASDTGLLVSMAVYFLGDVLDKTVIDRCFAEVKFRMTDAFLKHDDYWWEAIPTKPGEKRFVNNWNPWVCGNLIYVLAVLPFEREYQHNCLAKTLEVLDYYIDSIPDDGGSEEGAGYWSAPSLHISLEGLYEITDGVINVFGEEKLRRFADYGTCICPSYKYIINFSDAVHKRKDHTPDLNFALGKTYNLPVLCAEAHQIFMSDGGKVQYVYSDLRATVNALLREKQIREFDVSAIPKERFVSSRYLEKIELLTEWQNRKEGKGLFLAAKGGNNGDSHAHNDLGSLMVYADGEPFFIDPGKGTYTKDHFNENRYKIWTNTSSWHNLPDINGEVQYHGKDFTATNTVFTPGNTESRFNLDLEKAYGGKAKLKNFNRDIRFDKVNGIVSVTDKFDFVQEENEITENLILANKPEIIGNTAYVTTVAGTKCKLEWSGEGDVEVEFKDTSYDDTLSYAWPTGVYRIRITYSCKNKSVFSYKLSLA